MADIVTSIGVDDRAARAALKDYQRFAERTTDAADERRNKKSADSIALLTRRLLTLEMARRGIKGTADAMKEFAKANDDAAASLYVVGEAWKSFTGWVGKHATHQLGAAIDWYAPGATVGAKALIQQRRRNESMEFADPERRRIEAEIASFTSGTAGQRISEELRHREALATYKLRMADKAVLQEMVALETRRHRIAMERIDTEEKGIELQERVEADLQKRETLSNMVGLRGRIARAGGDPFAQLAADRLELSTQYQHAGAAIIGDAKLSDRERTGRLASLNEQHRLANLALTSEFEKGREDALRTSERQVAIDRMGLEVDRLRLAGFTAEADVRGAILNFEQRISEIRDNENLSEDSRASLITSLRGSQESVLTAMLGEQERMAALANYQGGRSVVLPGGVRSFGGGPDVRGLAFSGGGASRQANEELRRQTVTLERLHQLLGDVRADVQQLSGTTYR